MSTDPLDLLTGYQPAAIVATACETGVADALAGGARTPADVAATARTDVRATAMLLGAMVALGLARRGDDGGFALTEDGATLARDHPQSVAGIVAKEWFFYRVWAELPLALRDGHARIAPWRDRLRDDPGTALQFLRALDDLAARFGGGLPALADLGDVPAGARLLDVGGGAGSHAAHLVAAHPGLRATVLDLPEVEPVLRERHGGLSFVAGDLHAPRFGRPGGESWDIVLLANILHDHPPEQNAEIVRRAAGLLTPGGTLLVYEWVLGADRVSPRDVALFAPMMLVENEGGGVYTEEEIGAWLHAAGLTGVTAHRGPGPIAVVKASRR